MKQIKDGKLKALQAKAEAAQSAFEATEQQLYRGDGARVYGDAEHEERLRTLRSERTAELRGIQEEASQIGEAARAEITNVENRDPAELATSDELAAATARRPFAQDASASLDVKGLIARLRSVLATGDRGAVLAWLAAGEGRRGQIIERRRDEAEDSAGTPAARASVSKFTPLDEILQEMRGVLDGGKSVSAIEAARSRESEAVAVELLAGNLTVGARRSSEAHGLRNYGPEASRIRAGGQVR